MRSESIRYRSFGFCSSTPVQTLGTISCNSMSGIRQFTPEEGQYSLLRPTAASKPSKYRNLYGLSPLTASFGVLPLETSPSESYVISPTALTENSDQKIIAKRQLLGKAYVYYVFYYGICCLELGFPRKPHPCVPKIGMGLIFGA